MQFNEIVGFKLNCGIKSVLESISHYPFHIHTSVLEIICVINGRFKISDTARDYILSYGDVYFFNNEDAHKIEKLDPDSILLTTYIDLEHYRPFYTFFHNNEDYDLVSTAAYFICDSFADDNKYSIDIRYLRFLLAKIYTEYSSSSPSEHELESLGKQLLDHILENYQDYAYSKSGEGKYIIVNRDNIHIHDKKYKRVYDIIDYIYAHSREKLTLREIASMEYLNPSYLSTYIKKASGLTFSEILSVARCEEATMLLGDTDKSMDEIATMVGFANRSNLTVQFKKWFSKTPAQYRRNIRADLSRSSNIKYDSFDYSLAIMVINAYLDGY